MFKSWFFGGDREKTQQHSPDLGEDFGRWAIMGSCLHDAGIRVYTFKRDCPGGNRQITHIAARQGLSGEKIERGLNSGSIRPGKIEGISLELIPRRT